ncbi:centrosomal protein POC5 isoform X2 [Seriola dumerili]|uniref:centrosomal protein POC5 isoform X2 n=1 Tax=Seriola dumerili TaxID=41447 RepID=UPI000BBF27D5|nr:centrosomal protein POC5 isoform X2 [Seriola dumerili]
MSSDEEEPTSPVLPKDSDQGSSVSSELQDEYEELLRYAVVAPKLDTLTSAYLQRLSTSHLFAEGRSSQRKDETKSKRPADAATEAKDGRHSSRSVRSSQASPLIVEPTTHSRASHVEEVAGRASGRASVLSDRLQPASERSRPNSPDPLESAVAEMFISEKNISKMENILDTWSNSLKAHAAQVAQQHYNLQLKKKVWLGWHSLVQKHWKVKVERACRARAEEVCANLSTEYEAKLAEHCEAIEKAQAEIQRLRLERERYEESMKKAFMRGVCALNMEALSMFHTAEGRPEQTPVHDQHDPLPAQDEPSTATMAQLQPYPISSTRFSPVHFDGPDPPSHSEAEDVVGSGASVSRAEVLPPTTVVHSSLPLGGIASSNKQLTGRAVTASQQKPSKTVTARVTARPDVGKAARSNLQVMGVAPPMSSVIIERHHPVTQLTLGQATAAKYPRSSQQGHSSTGGRGSSKTHTSTCHVHSIKVVD